MVLPVDRYPRRLYQAISSVPSFAGSNINFCPYDTVLLGGPPNPTYIYAWSPPTGLNDTSSSAPLPHLSNSSSDSALHTYFVRTTFNSNIGCSSIDSVTVKLYPNPTINFIKPKIRLNDAIDQFYDSTYNG
jgi:hypothetical protein